MAEPKELPKFVISAVPTKRGGGKGRTFSEPVFRPLDDESVEAEADRFGQRAYGRVLSPQEVEVFRSVYRILERRAFSQNMRAARAQFGRGGGEVEELSDAGFTDQLAEELAAADPNLGNEQLGHSIGEIGNVIAEAVQ